METCPLRFQVISVESCVMNLWGHAKYVWRKKNIPKLPDVEKKWPFPPPKEHIGMTRAALLKAADLHPPVKP